MDNNPEPLASQRALFDIPDNVAYLNCAYMSPLLRASVEAGQAGVARKLQPWRIGTEDFFSGSEEFRGLAARLLNASAEDVAADEVAIVPSVSYGIETAARNVPVARGQRIVMLAEQFPSNVYPWRRMAEERGATIDSVAWPADGDWTGAVLAALKPDVAVAALPQVQWTSGGVLDLVSIGEACRQNGTALVLDLTQSLGAMPFDAQAVQPDFAVAANYKWLLGPYSLGLLYVAPKWQQGEPLEAGWIQRDNARDFTRLTDYSNGYDAGARRFDMGERSNFALLGAACVGMRQLLDWGVERISATCAALNRPLVERAAEWGFEAWPEARRAPHYLCLRSGGAWPAELAAKLKAANIHVSLRGAAMRITPHVYNTPEEMDRLGEVLQEHSTATTPG